MRRRTTSTRTRILPRLVAAALLAAGCSDAVGPAPGGQRAPGRPAFATTAPTPISLDRQNASLGQTGTGLAAGFYPTNPQVGDAIVATFVWLGSTNIITSVTDRLSSGTAVGNSYTLADYVTAGGLSMATYVATNVGNFPSPNADQGSVLVVQANLSASVTGGLLLSSYRGVDQQAATGVGARSHGSGAASSTAIADPGSVSIGAGALVYGVTFANLGGVSPPPNAQNINTTSDGTSNTKFDGEYFPPAGSAGAADPRWTWSFNSASTWLATALVLNPPAVPPGPATRLTFTAQPTTTSAGAAISPPVRVAAQDGAGNTDGTFTGTITIALGTNPSGGTLTGTQSVNAVNGVATFSNLSIGTPGSGYTLQASASSLTGATSAAFNVRPQGVVLDRFDGTSGLSGGTRLVKGFNPTNPHVGDAIVATFFWTGSNQITAVTDHLTNSSFQLVGNTYHLVDLVSAGGMSMATYVATNVQNFPDAYSRPAQDSTLAVQADFASPLVDGGLLISAYSGVAPDFATAFGLHSSTSGSGTGTTTADPGAITVGAGALAYGTSVASLANVTVPTTPFKNITTQSDSKLNSSGDYAVPASAGAVDPQWTWFYNGSGTWLATVFALNAGNAPPPTGNLTVTTTTSGSSQPSGYTVAVDGGASQPIGTAGSVTFTNLSATSHTVTLSGVPGNCTVSGGTSQTVTVPAGGTATAGFTVSCTATTGNLTVTTTTSGSSQPSGYTVAVDGGAGQAIGTAGSVTFTNLSAGSHSVTLTNVASNCTVSGSNPRTVTVPSGGTATTTFSVSCTTPPGNLTVTTSTSGSSLPSGYTVAVDGGAGQAIGTNASVTFTTLSAGSHSVTLTNVASNCTVSGSNPQTVTVPSGGTATTTFSVSCTTPPTPPVVNAGSDQTVLLGLLYSENASFTDAGNDGPWSYTIDWGDGSSSGGSTSSQGTISAGHTYLLLGQYRITVTVTDSHGASGSSSKLLTVIL
ncbi:MAG TPA: PKD domain-containing protein [Gemmatimonadales bacterium]|nr:PKD domain-containing protein [Gemmatimonadales bacterium]